MIVDALKLFLDPEDFFVVTGVELFIGLEQAESSLVFVDNNGLRVTGVGKNDVIVPDEASNGACTNLDDILVALFELLLEQFAKRLLYLSISPLYRLLNNIEGALLLLAQMAE